MNDEIVRRVTGEGGRTVDLEITEAVQNGALVGMAGTWRIAEAKLKGVKLRTLSGGDFAEAVDAVTEKQLDTTYVAAYPGEGTEGTAEVLQDVTGTQYPVPPPLGKAGGEQETPGRAPEQMAAPEEETSLIVWTNGTHTTVRGKKPVRVEGLDKGWFPMGVVGHLMSGPPVCVYTAEEHSPTVNAGGARNRKCSEPGITILPGWFRKTWVFQGNGTERGIGSDTGVIA